MSVPFDRSQPLHQILCGLYLILDEAWGEARSLVQVIEEASAQGTGLFQYRCKGLSMNKAFDRGVQLCQTAQGCGALFIVNDRCDLALAVKADGVHLGQRDLPPRLGRAIMGPDKLIGLSTHTRQQVIDADKGEVDYVGFGPIFLTATKTDHELPVGVEGIRQVRTLTSLPFIAIGGIQPDSVEAIIRAGADGVAVASGILQSEDTRMAVQMFMKGLGPPVEPSP